MRRSSLTNTICLSEPPSPPAETSASPVVSPNRPRKMRPSLSRNSVASACTARSSPARRIPAATGRTSRQDCGLLSSHIGSSVPLASPFIVLSGRRVSRRLARGSGWLSLDNCCPQRQNGGYASQTGFTQSPFCPACRGRAPARDDLHRHGVGRALGGDEGQHGWFGAPLCGPDGRSRVGRRLGGDRAGAGDWRLDWQDQGDGRGKAEAKDGQDEGARQDREDRR